MPPSICVSHYDGSTAPETEKVFLGSCTMFLEKKRMFYLSLLNLLVEGRRDQAEGQSQLLQ